MMIIYLNFLTFGKHVNNTSLLPKPTSTSCARQMAGGKLSIAWLEGHFF
jgi:hypothetical protein